MGCDIHLYVERKVNGVWQGQLTQSEPQTYYRKRWYYNRNYVLFGLLAGVRCSEIKPLSEPRGIPDDVSELVKEDWKIYGSDGHTPSYFSLPELILAKEQNSIFTGYVDMKNYRIYKETGQPNHVMSDLNDIKYTYRKIPFEVVPEPEMERYFKMKAFLGETEFVTEIIWERPNKTISVPFWDELLDKLKNLDPDPSNVRIVFWFDN